MSRPQPRHHEPAAALACTWRGLGTMSLAPSGRRAHGGHFSQLSPKERERVGDAMFLFPCRGAFDGFSVRAFSFPQPGKKRCGAEQDAGCSAHRAAGPSGLREASKSRALCKAVLSRWRSARAFRCRGAGSVCAFACARSLVWPRVRDRSCVRVCDRSLMRPRVRSIDRSCVRAHAPRGFVHTHVRLCRAARVFESRPDMSSPRLWTNQRVSGAVSPPLRDSSTP